MDPEDYDDFNETDSKAEEPFAGLDPFILAHYGGIPLAETVKLCAHTLERDSKLTIEVSGLSP